MHVFYTYPTVDLHRDKKWNIVLESLETYEQYCRDCMDAHYELYDPSNDWQLITNVDFPFKNWDKVNWSVDWLGAAPDEESKHDIEQENIVRTSKENEYNYRFKQGQNSLLSKKLYEILNTDWLRCNLILQPPGNSIPQHVDWNVSAVNNPADENSKNHRDLFLYQLHKTYWFPDDQKPGQKFRIGRDWIEWKAGDLVWWPWYMEHNTENLSDEPRRSVHVTSIVYTP